MFITSVLEGKVVKGDLSDIKDAFIVIDAKDEAEANNQIELWKQISQCVKSAETLDLNDCVLVLRIAKSTINKNDPVLADEKVLVKTFTFNSTKPFKET
jgi:hypothetical protein